MASTQNPQHNHLYTVSLAADGSHNVLPPLNTDLAYPGGLPTPRWHTGSHSPLLCDWSQLTFMGLATPRTRKDNHRKQNKKGPMDFPERTYHLRVSERSLCSCHLVHISVLSQLKLLTDDMTHF